MLQRLREARNNQHGFTLIELLIVIVILGILAGVVVFAVSGVNDRGNVAACKSDKKTIEVAQEAHYAKTATYAADIAALQTAGFVKQATSAYVTTNNTGVVSTVAGAPAGC
ncbi:MAG TPA: prepilin-type N-terminal cleavage/methylation domain-containing protein [Pseudonocardiaceae bacterium]|jgi:general secretion pathway protein G